MSKEKTPELPDEDADEWQDDQGYCDKGNDIILGDKMP
jgi:hypothetical protein